MSPWPPPRPVPGLPHLKRVTMSSPESENGIVVAVPQSAVTYRRKPAAPDVEALENAGVPRANLAVSAETPGGTAEQPQDKQEHVKSP